MKNKNLIKYFALINVIVVLLIIVYATLIKIQNKLLFKSYLEYNPSGNYVANREFTRCNYNFFDPEIARLIQFKEQNYINLFYYKPKALFNPSRELWSNSLNGSTRIYNLPFSQALQMLKKDCSQFKQDYNYEETYGDFERQKNEVYWKYSRKTNLDDINIVEEGKEAVTNETETKIDKEWLEQNLKEYGFDNNEIKDILNKE